ncbi:MAG: hypothetical protein ACO36E_11090, partial [Synechocystis sp.]
MKNFRFWLMTEVVACCLVALSPAQAETSESFEKTLASLPNTPTLAEMETAIATEIPPLSNIKAGTMPLDMARVDGVSPTTAPTVSADLIQELEALSTASSLNFPASSETSVAQMTPSNRPTPPGPASGQQPLFPNPEIIIQQQGASPQSPSRAGNPTILNPRVPVAPLRSRAVPPPVG